MIAFKHGDYTVQMSRGMFLVTVSGALFLWSKGVFSNHEIETVNERPLPRPQVISVERKITSWTEEELALWIHSNPRGDAWRIENGVLQVLDTILLGTAARAIGGTLSLLLELNDSGTANFLFGSDPLAQQCVLLKLVSTPARLTLQPFLRGVDGVVSQVGVARTLDRHNRSKHEVAIAFTGSTIEAMVNGERGDWSNLQIAAGHIGLAGQENDGFRVFQAELALTT